MLKIKTFVFNPFGENTYIVFDTESLEAIVVDPGMTSPAEYRLFDSFIEDNNLKLTQIVNTHLHLDHCFGNNYVRDRYNIKTAAHTGDAFLGNDLAGQCRQFGFMPGDPRPAGIDIDLKPGDRITVGAYNIDIIHIPGHSPGSIGLYCRQGNFVIVGDVLFKRGIGRTDLPGGNYRTLQNSISKQLYTLPDKTLVLPGHGPTTTIIEERNSNPCTGLS